MLTPAASHSQTDFDYTTVITTPSHLIQKGTPTTPPNLKKNKRMALPQNIGANTSSIAVRSTPLLGASSRSAFRHIHAADFRHRSLIKGISSSSRRPNMGDSISSPLTNMCHHYFEDATRTPEMMGEEHYSDFPLASSSSSLLMPDLKSIVGFSQQPLASMPLFPRRRYSSYKGSMFYWWKWGLNTHANSRNHECLDRVSP